MFISVDIDLSDESGNIKNLRDPHIQSRYANEVLEEREKLVLLKVESKSFSCLAIHTCCNYSVHRFR